ncbi:ABC transporter substrate-binding protein [Paenibacillus sp. FJAT-26967]|uniref:ABC transporter substrate-binding protein n=1 Tax=Paenibacillus sp. FJAT-26967 TaxID=1729690 RepID=UPI000839953E|nr:extracellular solute-binding protein [Paenibacillus sp. FJAT-26967]
MRKTAVKGMSLLLAMALVLMLAACGNGDDKSSGGTGTDGKAGEAVKLKFYAQYSGENIPVYDAAKAELKKVMPEVDVDFEVAAQDDEQKIKTYAAAGNLPDIFFASSGLIDVFKKSNNILALDNVIKENKIEEKLNETSKTLLWDQDGHSYAVPNVGQWASLIFINKKVFEDNGVKVPANYDEFLTAVQTFKSKNITPLSLFAKEKWPGVQLMDMAIVSEEPGGLKKLESGQGTFSDAAYTKAADKLSKLTAAGLLSSGAFNTNWEDALAQFTSGKAAMTLNGAWAMNDITKAMGDNVDIIYAPFADKDKAEAVKWNVSGGGFNQGFAVSANSKNKDIAAKYAALFSIEFAKQRILLLGDPNPILKDAPQPNTPHGALQKKYVADSANFKTMTTFPWGLSNAKFKTSVEDNTQKFLVDRKTDAYINDMNKALELARK